MNNYITGAVIRQLREQKRLTQTELAEKIGVTDKAVSKWETAKGFPDISLIESLASALGVSVMELLSGEQIHNKNRSANMMRAKFYACPVCGNVIQSTGDALVSCCGITLPAMEAEDCDGDHDLQIERVEDEYFVSVRHEMTKKHYISFLAYITSDRVQMVKLYPEGNAEVRFPIYGSGVLYLYCNQHGLMKKVVNK